MFNHKSQRKLNVFVCVAYECIRVLVGRMCPLVCACVFACFRTMVLSINVRLRDAIVLLPGTYDIITITFELKMRR